MNDIPRVNAILKDKEYLSYMQKNKQAEATRVFCVHDMEHVLSVCRIGYAMILEEGLPYSKELIYAVGLLHDIGRWVQIETGEDHAKAGAERAGAILRRHGFTSEEEALILRAIAHHRVKEHPDDFSRILYRADKASRECWQCPEIGKCKRFRNGETPELTY
jgi:HD superfamily phosphodiesterase